ncbi:MAG: GAF domain-containing protein [Bacteroidales bacterium]|nr:GAF domain-containing protein [Bacteroidales bacterium]
MRRSLRLRIFISIFLSVSTIYVAAIIMILIQVQTIFTQNLTNETRRLVHSSSTFFNVVFGQDIEILRSLKNTLNSLYEDNFDDFILKQDKVIKGVISETPQFLSIGISWELNSIYKNYTKNHGRYRYLYYWRDGNIISKTDTLNMEEEALNSLYYLFKISMRDDITDIYFDSYTGLKEDEQLMNSIGIPIVRNNKFAGLVAADISLERLYNIITQLKPIPEAQTFMVSHTGNIVANSTGEYINQSFSKILKDDVSRRNLLFSIQNAQSEVFIQKDSLGNKNFVILEPFYFGNINRAWSLGTIVPLKVIRKDSNKFITTAIVLAIIGLFLMIFITLLILNSIIKPINYSVESLEKISNFDISSDYKMEKVSSDELGRMVTSINNLIDSLTGIKTFTYEISKGNLDVKYTAKSDKDELGNAILEMQRSLKIAKMEEEKRNAEEKIQNWIINGESKIAEILRENSQNIEDLSYQVVSYLVKYTNAAQGALFMVNDEEKEIELLSAYAYERRKFLQKIIPFGVGLVGRSVQEGELVYITDIPDGYSSISSGLGDKQPRSLIIVPFKFNEVIYAVIELNSFGDFKPHIRRFIEKIGVSVASTIANLQITLRTNKLVQDLQSRSQILIHQEEELRQNIEEMKTTQDELLRKATEYEGIVNALNKVSYVVVYDMDRRIIDINNRFLNFLNKTKSDMIGAEQGLYINDPTYRAQLDDLWQSITAGRVTTFTQKALIAGNTVWFSEAYIPILDDEGKPYKVINISNDITNIKNK